MPREPVDPRRSGPGGGGSSSSSSSSSIGRRSFRARAREANLPHGPLRRLVWVLVVLLKVGVEARPRPVGGPDLDAAVDAARGEAVGGAGPRDGGRLKKRGFESGLGGVEKVKRGRGRKGGGKSIESIPNSMFLSLSRYSYRSVVRPEVPSRVHFERVGSRHEKAKEGESKQTKQSDDGSRLAVF